MAEMEKEMKETPAEETPAEETVETAEEVVETNPWEEKYNAERDAHLRVAAEFDNFRKRTIKEKEGSYGNGKADAVAKMLPIYDNLERALNQPTEDAAYKKGVEMTMANRTIFSPILKPFWKTCAMVFSPSSSESMCITAWCRLGANASPAVPKISTPSAVKICTSSFMVISTPFL